MIQFEAACFNKASALVALDCNVDRIELCEHYSFGGITPSMALVDEISEKTTTASTKLNLMIRPRAGDFVYASDEFEEMKTSILENKHKADGFVFGILTYDNKIDACRAAELVRIASPRPCTFHRAFDEVEDKLSALEDVRATGCRSILTSGGPGKALQNVCGLEVLLTHAAGIDIIVGGGIRSSNLPEVLHNLKPHCVHSAALTDRTEDVNKVELQRIRQLLKDHEQYSRS